IHSRLQSRESITIQCCLLRFGHTTRLRTKGSPIGSLVLPRILRVLVELLEFLKKCQLLCGVVRPPFSDVGTAEKVMRLRVLRVCLETLVQAGHGFGLTTAQTQAPRKQAQALARLRISPDSLLQIRQALLDSVLPVQ